MDYNGIYIECEKTLGRAMNLENALYQIDDHDLMKRAAEIVEQLRNLLDDIGEKTSEE